MPLVQTEVLRQAGVAEYWITSLTAWLDRSRFGGGWGIFRGFLNLGGTDDGIDTEGV